MPAPVCLLWAEPRPFLGFACFAKAVAQQRSALRDTASTATPAAESQRYAGHVQKFGDEQYGSDASAHQPTRQFACERCESVDIIVSILKDHGSEEGNGTASTQLQTFRCANKRVIAGHTGGCLNATIPAGGQGAWVGKVQSRLRVLSPTQRKILRSYWGQRKSIASKSYIM